MANYEMLLNKFNKDPIEQIENKKSSGEKGS